MVPRGSLILHSVSPWLTGWDRCERAVHPHAHLSLVEQNEVAGCVRQFPYSEWAMHKDETPSGTTRMRTMHLIVKRTVLGLIGIMVVSAICFSSIMPSSLRLVELEDGETLPAAKPVLPHSGRN